MPAAWTVPLLVAGWLWDKKEQEHLAVPVVSPGMTVGSRVLAVLGDCRQEKSVRKHHSVL